MNRTTVVALAAAAVVGVVGGSVAAVVHDPSPARASGSSRAPASTPSAQTPAPTKTPAPSSATTPSPSASPASPSASATSSETNEPLLYLAGGVLHDGTTTVRVTRAGTSDRLVRTPDGWLVAMSTGKDPLDDLWFLRPDGSSRKLATVTTWDADPTARQVVGYDETAGQVKVWSLPTGKVTGTYATEGDPTLTPAFAGSEVLISQDIGDRIDLVRWDPSTQQSDIVGKGVALMASSPGGSYLAGNIADQETCLQVQSTFLKKYPVDWHTCAWRVFDGATRFSPDGTRLLAVPSDTSGSDASTIRVFDATDGPDKPVATFSTPVGAVGVEWADDDHVYVWGTSGDDPSGATWVRRCDFQGGCTESVRTTGPIALGSGT